MLFPNICPAYNIKMIYLFNFIYFINQEDNYHKMESLQLNLYMQYRQIIYK